MGLFFNQNYETINKESEWIYDTYQNLKKYFDNSGVFYKEDPIKGEKYSLAIQFPVDMFEFRHVILRCRPLGEEKVVISFTTLIKDKPLGDYNDLIQSINKMNRLPIVRCIYNDFMIYGDYDLIILKSDSEVQIGEHVSETISVFLVGADFIAKELDKMIK